MKYILWILFISFVAGLIYGYQIKDADPKTGHLIIGLSIVLLFFVFMPLFSYHRWRKKDVKDYMLTKENIEKMQDYNKEEKE